MKKILSLIGSLSLTMISVSTVIACGDDPVQAQQEGKVDLSTHIATQRIADFDHDNVTDDEILAMAKQTNSNLNLNEVEITHNPSTQAEQDFIPNEAVLTVKNNSEVYNPGSMIVYFTDPTHPRIGLINVLKQTDLGEMLLSVVDQRPAMEFVKTRLKELNPVLDLEDIHLTFNEATQEEISQGGTVDLKLGPNSPYYHGPGEDYTLTYRKQTSLIDLDQVIKITDLGDDIDFVIAWSDVPLIRLIGSLNPLLEIRQVAITSKTRDFNGHLRLTVIQDSTVYNPSFVDFTFNTKVNIDLESVLTNLNLGTFDDEPTDQQILARLKQLNPLVDLDEIYIVSNIKNKVIIRERFGTAKYWQTRIELNYTVKNLPYLQNIWNAITVTDLGELNVETNPQTVILAKVKELNPLLNLVNLGVEQIEVLQHRNGFATIRVIENSKIYSPGSIEVSYINQNRFSFIDVAEVAPVRNTVLGINSLDDIVNDHESVLKNLKYFNLDLDIEQVMIEESEVRPLWGNDLFVAELWVKIKAKDDSNIYLTDGKTYNFIFNIFKNVTLDSIFLKTDLGSFKSVPTFQELANRIFRLNDKVTNSIIYNLQLHLENDGEGTVIMSVKFPGFEILKGTVRLTYTIDQE